MSSSTDGSDNVQPPTSSYYRTLYDETFRSVFYRRPSIASMANRANLIGRLEHHAPTTDGSFSICIAGGEGVFISKALYESIPKEHRPALDTTAQCEVVNTLFDVPMDETLGSTLIPFILTNKKTGEKFRIVLYALVLPNMFMNMFIGDYKSPIVRTSQCTAGGYIWGFSFGEDQNDLTIVQGV